MSYTPGDLFAERPFLRPVPQFPPLPCGSLLSKAPWFNGAGALLLCYLGWGMRTLNLACSLHRVRGKEGEPFGVDRALPGSPEG